ncbi:BbrUII/HgiDII family restriction enzyme [Vibrio harveyi]|uniref:BbrUII/HgiDII family restriction enzyme n=1 Tax=Vibrio harveyi TaxID=669 RepID=UPI00406951EA
MSEGPETELPLYTMTISLNVLKHLGINLYSSVPAVITEAVANAWDADANEVIITAEKEDNSIIILDDGDGMTLEDINKRFLEVGHDRRESGFGRTLRGRNVMGRKGLGKLSLFSIAQKIEVYTKKDGQEHAFVLDYPRIVQAIEGAIEGDYHPEPIKFSPPQSFEKGTLIHVKELNKKRKTSASILKRSLARRFSVIGEANGFVVEVNGEKVDPSDREYLSKLEYLWYFGGQEQYDIIKSTTNAELFSGKDNGLIDSSEQWSISGWIGTTKSSGDLKAKDDEGNLNSIVLMARGRVVHENLLSEINDGGLYTKYISGEINADFLDEDDLADIATSSRQALVEDDPRVLALKSYIVTQLKFIAKEWTRLRNERGADNAEKENTAIKEWIEGLRGDSKKAARKLIGHIEGLPFDDTEDGKQSKKEIFKYGIIAFEKLRMKERVSDIEKLTTFNSEQFRALFDEVDELEASFYYDIISERLKIIKTLKDKAADNDLEVEMQRHIFKHMWLLDPSWERANNSEYMEKSLSHEFGSITSLSDEEKKGRLDIKYTKMAGSHVIVELKRNNRNCTAQELYEQGGKYLDGLTKAVRESDAPEPWVEVVFLLGEPPIERRPGEAENLFKMINARWTTYQQLVNSAYNAYSTFLNDNRDAQRIDKIVKKL